MKNKTKKIIIIGAGVAGLCAGVHALNLGYQVELFEKNSVPGGECTGWDRKGYHIDNCIHWMIGSKSGSDLNKLYVETGALENTPIYSNTIMYKSYLNGQSLALYNDLEKTKEEWIKLSPEDETEINELFKWCKIGKETLIPAGTPPEKLGAIKGIILLIRSIPTFRLMGSAYKNEDINDLINRFKHPLIRACISDFVTKESKASNFPMCYGNFLSGDGGIPVGGSRAMSFRMKKKFELLSGIYHSNTAVKEIVVNKNFATGIITEDKKFYAADYIIPACDAEFLFSNLLDKSYMDKQMKDYFDKPEVYPIYGMVQAAWAVDSSENLLDCEVNIEAPTLKENPWMNNRIALKTYFYEPDFAPKGKQIIQSLWGMDQSSWQYWQKLGENKEKYKEKKAELALIMQKAIEEFLPGYKGKLSLLDVWTPCTYKRYCNAHNGYNQACVISKKSPKMPYPSAYIKKLKNVVLAGQWVTPPGGIPGSCITGKFAACRVDAINRKIFFTIKKAFFQFILPSIIVLLIILL